MGTDPGGGCSGLKPSKQIKMTGRGFYGFWCGWRADCTFGGGQVFGVLELAIVWV